MKDDMNNVTLSSAAVMLLALAIGNFGWAWATDVSSYESAFERTYFQGWALFFAWSMWSAPY